MPRKKKCRSCGEWFQPFYSMAKACSMECAIGVARQDAEKRERKRHRQDKERIKPRGELMREAQQAFNAWIRWRDRDEPCISCGTSGNDGSLTGGYWDCGHYRSVGANPELRFEPLNAAKQCKRCNRDLSGNVVDYRINLRARIGDESLDWLEGPHPPKKYSTDDLRAIRDHYRRKLREEKRAAGE